MQSEEEHESSIIDNHHVPLCSMRADIGSFIDSIISIAVETIVSVLGDDLKSFLKEILGVVIVEVFYYIDYFSGLIKLYVCRFLYSSRSQKMHEMWRFEDESHPALASPGLFVIGVQCLKNQAWLE